MESKKWPYLTSVILVVTSPGCMSSAPQMPPELSTLYIYIRMIIMMMIKLLMIMIVISIVIITLIRYIYIYTLWTWSFTTCEIIKLEITVTIYIYTYTYQLYINYKFPFLLAKSHCFCHFWWLNSSMFPQKTQDIRRFRSQVAEKISGVCLLLGPAETTGCWKIATERSFAWRLKRLSPKNLGKVQKLGINKPLLREIFRVKSCLKNQVSVCYNVVTCCKLGKCVML